MAYRALNAQVPVCWARAPQSLYKPAFTYNQEATEVVTGLLEESLSSLLCDRNPSRLELGVWGTESLQVQKAFLEGLGFTEALIAF